MKKKTSTLAIVFAVIMSIIIFPFVFAGSTAAGAVFSMSSVLQPGREEELYEVFSDNGGIDWIYDLFMEELGEDEVYELADGVEISAKELFTKEDMEAVVDGILHALMKGEQCYLDLSKQKVRLKETAMEYFAQESERLVKEEMGETYNRATEAEKEEIMQELQTEYEAEIDRVIEEEVSALEQDLSAIINEFYTSEEYLEIKRMEEETGYSLTDRTELYSAIQMCGNILFGITVVFLFLVVLCHFFRPSGFFVAGAFSLAVGGIMLVLPNVFSGLLDGLLYEEIAASDVPDSVYAVIEEVYSLIMSGFTVVSRYNLIAGVIIILLGVLILVNRKNKAVAE